MPVPVTVPLPVPAFETVSVRWATAVVLNVAVTLLLALIVSVQVVPVQSPLQPAKVEPAAGLAVSGTPVPSLYVSEQSAPHEMPVPVTVPLPVPALETLRVRWIGSAVLKVAVT